jgi:hypothetical protein
VVQGAGSNSRAEVEWGDMPMESLAHLAELGVVHHGPVAAELCNSKAKQRVSGGSKPPGQTGGCQTMPTYLS